MSVIPVTQANVRPLPIPERGGKVLARASAVLGGCFKINGIEIVEPRPGEQPIVAMPCRFSYVSGRFVDDCHPISQEMRREINQAILSAYYDLLNNEEEEE